MSARVLDAAPSLSTVSLNRSVSSSETRTPRNRFIRVGVISNPKGLPVDDIDAGFVDQLKLLEDRLDELGGRFISAGLKRSRLICYVRKRTSSRATVPRRLGRDSSYRPDRRRQTIAILKRRVGFQLQGLMGKYQ
jgi:hypothetical protein